MHILIINGSPRSNGATGQVLSKIKSTIEEMHFGANIYYADLGKMDIQFCKGCQLCYNTGECFIKEDGIEDLSRMIDKSDAVIFGSPEYANNVSGQFKVLIDRGHFVFEQLLRNKACFSVVTYENFTGGAKKVVNKLVRLSGGAVSCHYSTRLNSGDERFTLNDKQNERLEKLCRKFLNKASLDNPLSLAERIQRFIVFNIGIKPFAFKHKRHYEGVINRWVKQGVIPREICL